jgi:hypothetical protein
VASKKPSCVKASGEVAVFISSLREGSYLLKIVNAGLEVLKLNMFAGEWLSKSDACLDELLQLWVVWEYPDYLLLVVDYFVGAFEVVEYAVEGLVLDLSGETMEKLLLGWI